MIDAAVDSDHAALERTDSFNPGAAEPRVRRKARTSLPAYPPDFGKGGVEQGVLVVETPPSDSEPPSDPLGHLQAARVGSLAVVVLVFYWLWIRKKRQAR